MLFLFSYVICTAYKMRMCSDPSRVVQIPRTSPFATSPGLKDMHVRFAMNPAVRYKKSFIFDNLPKFTLCSSSIDRSIFWAPSSNSCNDFVVFPDDFRSCFKISFDGMCLQLSDDNTLIAGKCANVSTQSFEFIPLDLGEVSEQTLNAIKMREISRTKKGKLDLQAYQKLLEISKIAQKISKCMTLNGTCSEHATEALPPHCFVSFDLAHYIATDLRGQNDEIHHEEEKQNNTNELQITDADMEKFEKKYKSSNPNQITEPAVTEDQKLAANEKAENNRLVDSLRALRNRIFGAEDETPAVGLTKSVNDYPEISDLVKDADKMPQAQSLINTIAKEAKDKLSKLLNPFDFTNELNNKLDALEVNEDGKIPGIFGPAKDLIDKTQNKMREIRESLQKGKNFGSSLLGGIKGLFS